MPRNLLSLVCLVGLCLAVGSNTAMAQRVETNVSPSHPQNYRAKEVLGNKVHIEGNVSIGTVDDIVFDDEGFVEYLIVANEGKLVTVPWEAAKFNFQDRVAHVKITDEQFRKVPTYSQERYPVFSQPTYRTETYRYYNVTPRERRVDRRIDRRD